MQSKHTDRLKTASLIARKRQADEDGLEPRRSPRKPTPRTYKYETLLPGEIRVLVLAPGERDDPLRATLETVSIDEEPIYDAISYCWGEPVFPHKLWLPSGQLKITKSLSGALHRFRDSEKPVRLWADAVCIDQNGLREKNHQVNVMAQIYAKARRVVVWLGEAQDSDCLTTWALRAVHKARVDKDMNLPILVRGHLDPEEIKYLAEDFANAVCKTVNGTICPCCRASLNESTFTPKSIFTTLGALWKRPWFSRLWVIQEARFARFATFFYGDHYVEAKQLWSVAEQHRALLRETALCAHLLSEGSYDHWENHAFAMNDIRTGFRPPLEELIVSTTVFAVTDPHDRVYANRASANVKGLEPDYSLPLPQLWGRVVETSFAQPSKYYDSVRLKVMRASPFVMLSLSGTQSMSPCSLTPSWVPPLNNLTVEGRRKYEFHALESVHNSAGSTLPWEADFSSERHVLLLRSKILCRISAICNRSRHRSTAYKALSRETSKDLWQTVRTTLIPWYLNCYHFAVSLGKAPNVNNRWFALLLKHGRRIEDVQGLRFGLQHYEELRKVTRLAQAIKDYGLDLSRVEADLIPFLAWGGSTDEWFIDRTRVMASTADGQIGWVPGKCRIGDFVCLFKGSPFPFIIRERGDGYYTLIGDAYIHGIMHGEAWPENEEDCEWVGLK